jgi:hypothetical protein
LQHKKIKKTNNVPKPTTQKVRTEQNEPH